MAFPIGYSPSQIICRTWRRMCPHIPLKERSQIREVMLQKWEIQKTEAQYLFSLPQRPKLRHMFENQNYEGSLQKTQWGICSTSRKVWWLDNSGSQSLLTKEVNPGTVIDTQWWYKISPLDGYNLVRVKKNRRRRRRVSESFWSRHISQKVICTEKFMRIWQILWRVDMESSNIHSSSLRNKRNCRTSYTTSKRGNISCTIAIRTGW